MVREDASPRLKEKNARLLATSRRLHTKGCQSRLRNPQPILAMEVQPNLLHPGLSLAVHVLRVLPNLEALVTVGAPRLRGCRATPTVRSSVRELAAGRVDVLAGEGTTARTPHQIL